MAFKNPWVFSSIFKLLFRRVALVVGNTGFSSRDPEQTGKNHFLGINQDFRLCMANVCLSWSIVSVRH